MRFNEIVKIDEQALRDSVGEADNAVFFGKSVVVYPEALLDDPDINGEAFKLWAVMKRFADKQEPVPKQNELARQLRISRPTLIDALASLKIGRWMMILENSKNGLRSNNSYIVFAHKVSVSDALKIDKDYLTYLERKANAKKRKNRPISQITLMARAEIEQLPIKLRDTLSQHYIYYHEETGANTVDLEALDEELYESEAGESVNNEQAVSEEPVENDTSEAGRDEKIVISDGTDIEQFIYGHLSSLLKDKYGQRTRVLLLSTLKSNEHKHKGESFEYQLSIQSRIEILCALIQEDADKPLLFLRSLIKYCSQGEFILQRDQLQLYKSIEAQFYATTPSESTDIDVSLGHSIAIGDIYRVKKPINTIKHYQGSPVIINLNDNEQFEMKETGLLHSNERPMETYDADVFAWLISNDYVSKEA